MRKALALVAVAIVTAAVAWSQGWARHRVALQIVAPANDEGTSPLTLLTVRAVYRDGNREVATTVHDGVAVANTALTIAVPARQMRAFKRLEVQVLHPGFRPLALTSDRNPHWFLQRLPEITPEPWPVVTGYQPEPADEIEELFHLSRTRWVPALGEEDSGRQVWAYRDVLQTLVPRASFGLAELQGVPMDERRERIGKLRADQQYLMGLMRQPGTRGIESP